MEAGRKQRSKKNAKRKRHGRRRGGEALEDKVSVGGGRIGYGLEVPSDQEEEKGSSRKPGVYGSRSTSSLSSVPRTRLFGTAAASAPSDSVAGRKPSSNGCNRTASLHRDDQRSLANGSKFSLSSRTPVNPYQDSRHRTRRLVAPPRSSSHPRTSQANRGVTAAVHVVCAISENLARETCVVSLDAGAPVSLHVTKQGNGQTYAETLAYLGVLQPDEVLLNEGRRNSQLAKKVLAFYNLPQGTENPIDSDRNHRRKAQLDGRSRRRRGRLFAGSTTRGHNEDDDKDEDNPEVDRAGPCRTSTVVKFVPRSYFDQTKGAELLRRISREDTCDSNLVEEYIILSSSYAALQYTQLCLGATFSRNCLDITVNSGGNNRMMIDRSTLVHLELLANAKTGKMANSLIGTIDCTKTTVGSRLLRTNLMAPSTRIATINARLDLVDALLEDEEFFYVVMEHLEALPDVDKMLTNIALVPWKKGDSKNGGDEKQMTARIASKGISALVCIKSILSAIPAFARALEDQLKAIELRERASGLGGTVNRSGTDDNGSTMSGLGESDRANDTVSAFTDGSSLLIGLGGGPVVTGSLQLHHQLLRAILFTMKQPALAEVLNAVADVFTESTAFSRNAHAMRHQECFALKPNTDGMMDVLRKAFLANVDDIYRLADAYAETYGITVSVKETTSRGYYLSVPVDLSSDLPQVFIQPVKSGRCIHCTTEEVHSLNARAQANVQDLLLMTHDRIQAVLDVARTRYDALASLSDAIALLDMCHCFADNVASSRLPWCRPAVTDGPVVWNTNTATATPRAGSGGDIAIRNGRYGIDVTGTGLATSDGSISAGAGMFIPNDTYASEFQNFSVVTGVNGSGKSTYLKQIAIIVVLAHCGSYVPAEKVSIPIRDRLCTRIGTADDQEHNISTFMLEMKETAYICNNASKKSLILIDELGRATSNEDGVAIAWAASEFLLEKRAMTFFVTHYPQLSKLGDVYPTVQNQHMEATISEEDEGEINYTHKILPGPCRMATDYGVEMAATCGWPREVVAEARHIRKEVEGKLPDGALCQVESEAASAQTSVARRKAGGALHSLSSHLAALKESEAGLSSEAKRSYLQDLRELLIPTGDEHLIQCIKNLLLHDESGFPTVPLQPETLTCNLAESGQHTSSNPERAIASTRGTSAVARNLTGTQHRPAPTRLAGESVAKDSHIGAFHSSTQDASDDKKAQNGLEKGSDVRNTKELSDDVQLHDGSSTSSHSTGSKAVSSKTSRTSVDKPVKRMRRNTCGASSMSVEEVPRNQSRRRMSSASSSSSSTSNSAASSVTSDVTSSTGSSSGSSSGSDSSDSDD